LQNAGESVPSILGLIISILTLKGKNNETLTKAICNKGFSGNSSILPRLNFGAVGQVSIPQSLTAYSLSRWQQV
jgi:hypothetical protein